MENLTGLKSLNLSRNSITDLSPLKDLTDLENLYLYKTKITSVDDLADLTILKVFKYQVQRYLIFHHLKI